MTQEDTQRQGTVDTTRDTKLPKSKQQRQQGSGQPMRQQQQPAPSANPGGGEPDVSDTQRDRGSSTGARSDVERGGSGGDLPM